MAGLCFALVAVFYYSLPWKAVPAAESCLSPLVIWDATLQEGSGVCFTSVLLVVFLIYNVRANSFLLKFGNPPEVVLVPLLLRAERWAGRPAPGSWGASAGSAEERSPLVTLTRQQYVNMWKMAVPHFSDKSFCDNRQAQYSQSGFLAVINHFC